MRHGKEKIEHLHMKNITAILFNLLGWMVLFEEQLCDVVAWKCNSTGRMQILGIEVERANKNAVRNIRKDLSRGCDSILSVVRSERQRAALRRKLQQSLPHQICTKVGIVTIGQIADRVKRLENSPASKVKSLGAYPSNQNSPAGNLGRISKEIQ
jgi:hypothetical protein